MVPLPPARRTDTAPLGVRPSCPILQGHAGLRLLLARCVVMMVDEAYRHSSRPCARSGSIDHPRRVTKLCTNALTAEPMDGHQGTYPFRGTGIRQRVL